jgi:2-C-methyl-D-erythritol 2,4-cyclodiphosphate synthase
MESRIGQGFDFHPLVEGRKLILGGVAVPHTHGLSGHSDADVVTHALANAILGAIGEGDLGRHFPDSDPRFRGIDSIKLLERVWQMAADRGWSLGNADVTVFAQRPRLSPHFDAMRARLAAAMQSEVSRLNVKASSPEAIGALGRGEGMAAAAVAMLNRPDPK